MRVLAFVVASMVVRCCASQTIDTLRFTVLDSLHFSMANGAEFKLFALQDKAEAPDSSTARPLMLFRNRPTGWVNELRNDSAVLCATCGGVFGDPFEGFNLVDDTLHLYHYGGSSYRWSIEQCFVYDAEQDRWPLKMRKEASYWVFDPETTMEVTHRTEFPTPIDLGNFNAYVGP